MGRKHRLDAGSTTKLGEKRDYCPLDGRWGDEDFLKVISTFVCILLSVFSFRRWFFVSLTVFVSRPFFSPSSVENSFIKAYNVALAANFISGMISVVMGAFGPQMLTIIPPAALLVPVAGKNLATTAVALMFFVSIIPSVCRSSSTHLPYRATLLRVLFLMFCLSCGVRLYFVSVTEIFCFLEENVRLTL